MRFTTITKGKQYRQISCAWVTGELPVLGQTKGHSAGAGLPRAQACPQSSRETRKTALIEHPEYDNFLEPSQGIPLFRLLRDIEQYSHAGQRHKQRRSAIGNE